MYGKILLALATAPLAVAATAQDVSDQPDRFTVEMTISDNGKVVAEQRMVAVEGEPTFIEVEPAEGQSYRAQLFVSSEANGLLKTRSHWKATSPTLGTISFSPILKVQPGEAARIERGYESRHVKPLRVTYTVHPVAG
ncbi:hypothetical protein [uncultured Erythrobacter sp.]|uniref:hypothetical protein n=1 Tax=uncultured Erythrobacter sp. TaxID=263913 RepID=UPI00261475E9|nr:hypothetical protein [uncultured Erythrobacter sp.]